ncbi:gluconolactonase [Hydrogenophaga crassostreae]|uniref:Gluconolactonase n=1 Tax=Hydrogenophaga crassostreae TaxID=1763535 RepID=A0A162P4U4_9BURK|nr:SMP-30/gluconolactonase/LRE family protein [Hydrogenophaga crassostreae]AOW11628.1 gluconolactonase [Hydrogenophaga crassostreae]OAD41353.1 gluconolactonase [Hydrogenophaga crassostreae]
MSAPAANPLDGFVVDRAAIRTVGTDLQRPECILAERDGTLWAADARGGVTRIAADGAQSFIGQTADARFASAASDSSEAFENKFTQGTLPNGLAFAANGDILISNFGTDRLEVMSRDGQTRVLFDQINGQPIGKVNFVLRDSRDRIWLTVSTRVNPWTQAASSRVRDGYIAVLDQHGLRVVADGFHFTNEVRLDAREEWLYIVETTGPHISRMRLVESAQGVSLTDREVYGPADLGGPPDGIAFDAHGNLWCTLVMVDRLIAITPQGEVRLLLDDGDPAASEILTRKMKDGTATADDMAQAHGTVAPWMASITFGGPDLRTVYLGSLLGTRIPSFRSPVAGLPMVHWHPA